jgi:hypothetical protein
MNKITAQEVTIALDELRASLGPDFQLDDEGSCLVAYKENLPVLIQYIEADERLLFASELATGLADAPESEWLRLLSSDWLGFRTNGCALTPDFKAGAILIWRNAYLDRPTGECLEADFASFIRQVLDAREKLLAPAEEDASASAPSFGFAQRA